MLMKEATMDTTTLLIIILVLLVLFGGGGTAAGVGISVELRGTTAPLAGPFFICATRRAGMKMSNKRSGCPRFNSSH